MNLDRLKYRYWQHTDWHNENSPLEAVYCNAVDGCDPTIAVSDFEFCTGLKDKNGTLIYEGDLIKSPSNSYPLEIVRMPNGVYGCKVHKISPVWEMNLYSLIKAYDVEIIGNVHTRSEE